MGYFAAKKFVNLSSFLSIKESIKAVLKEEYCLALIGIL
jgi:hypothetical protein